MRRRVQSRLPLPLRCTGSPRSEFQNFFAGFLRALAPTAPVASGPANSARADARTSGSSVATAPPSAPAGASVIAWPPIAGRVRKAQYDEHPLPPGPVRDYLPVLLAAANAPNATAGANWKAFEALNACHALQVQIDASGDVRKQPQAPKPNGPDCGGVPEKDITESMRYLKRAAERGDDRAVYQYATGLPLAYMDRADLINHPQAVLEWRTDSMRYLNNAIDSGSTDAMFAMSRAYELGTLGSKDPVLAYQYVLEWRQLAFSADNSGVDAYPNQLAAGLSPDELARAQQGAQALIARCCAATK